jgi:hypothetical protein
MGGPVDSNPTTDLRWGGLGSDRNSKEQFTSIDPRAILDKVNGLPISEWAYKAEGASIRHIGPMAQDLRAVFRLGKDDKYIYFVDANGVALAAIKGLSQVVAEKDEKISLQERQITELERRVQMLEGRSSGATAGSFDINPLVLSLGVGIASASALRRRRHCVGVGIASAGVLAAAYGLRRSSSRRRLSDIGV